MKTCTACGLEKPLDEFHKDKRKQGAYRARCKACHSSRMKVYRDENSEAESEKKRAYYKVRRHHILERSKDYYEQNRDKKLAKQRETKRENGYNAAYYQANRDRLLEKNRAWRENNMPALRAGWRSYRMRNSAKINEKVAARKAAKIKATPAWADRQIMADMYAEAKYFGLTVDHIVPLISELVCGLHVEHNLQLLPLSENVSKNNRHWPDMP